MSKAIVVLKDSKEFKALDAKTVKQLSRAVANFVANGKIAGFKIDEDMKY